MRIKAKKGNRLAYWQQGQLIRWKYIDEGGLFDAHAKQYVGPFAEVDEQDYYMRALKDGSAILFEDEPITKEMPIIEPKPKFEKYNKKDHRGE